MANPHPKTENLAPPWPKGTSGNPNGRPRRPVTEAYARMFEERLPVEYVHALKLKPGSTWLDAVVQQHFRTMLKTTEVAVSARRETADRIEGKPAQRFEVRQAEEVQFHLVYEEPLVKRRIPDERKIIDVERRVEESVEEVIDVERVKQPDESES